VTAMFGLISCSSIANPTARLSSSFASARTASSAFDLARIKGKISDWLATKRDGLGRHVRDRLNRLVGGWSAYFGYGTLNAAYRSVDRHVCDRVRRFLNRRAKRGGRGAREYSWSDIFGTLGVMRLTRAKPAAPAVSLA